mgnify:FL=1
MHLAAEGRTPEVRKVVNESISQLAATSPLLVNEILREALTVFLSKGQAAAKSAEGSEQPQWTKHARLSSLLNSSVKFEESFGKEEREKIVVSLLTIAHHPLISASNGYRRS